MSTSAKPALSIIIPSFNEAASLRTLLPAVCAAYPEAEIILVNDGSKDDTVEVCADFPVRIISNPYNSGNGASVKRGAREANGEILIFMDADGQHQPSEIEKLLARMQQHDYDMVVGSRSGRDQANSMRRIANKVYSWLATWMTGHKVTDLTSGLRAVKAHRFREFLYLLPNGFSYPTTITMSFFRSGYSVGYQSINVQSRLGKSHIRPLKDGVRFLIILFRIGTLYSPLKLFLPLSVVNFLVGAGLYVYTYVSEGRFTNMSALLLSTSLLVFLIGMVSEQITNLMFARRNQP